MSSQLKKVPAIKLFFIVILGGLLLLRFLVVNWDLYGILGRYGLSCCLLIESDCPTSAWLLLLLLYFAFLLFLNNGWCLRLSIIKYGFRRFLLADL
jgi:hypothetical protein